MRICEYEPGLNTRPNDGKCDRAGNFVIGHIPVPHAPLAVERAVLGGAVSRIEETSQKELQPQAQ